MGSCAVKSSQSIIDPPENEQVLDEVRCPICSKVVGNDSEDPEIHLIMCLTRPKIQYNETKQDDDNDNWLFPEDKVEKVTYGSECIICLEELEMDDLVARLPCLCVYHKLCIDEWFKVSRSCPQHPGS